MRDYFLGVAVFQKPKCSAAVGEHSVEFGAKKMIECKLGEMPHQMDGDMVLPQRFPCQRPHTQIAQLAISEIHMLIHARHQRVGAAHVHNLVVLLEDVYIVRTLFQLNL